MIIKAHQSGAERFAFGENWKRFNAALTDEQRAAARQSLISWLGADLTGLTFLDIGAGSGLFTAAAAELGARVTAFDYDPSFGGIQQGDVLDAHLMQSLGKFDVVYSWGVLHHTGRMWDAVASAADAVAPGGRLLISLYNAQGRRSDLWRGVKQRYNRLPRRFRPVYVALVLAPLEARALLKAVLLRRDYLATWTRPNARGMSKWRDMVDWVGGYPFEVAKPEEVVDFLRARGFVLEKMHTDGGHGCNEFLFQSAA